jgi:hypothetical protein
MEYWQNDVDGRNPNYSVENLSCCPFVLYKSHKYPELNESLYGVNESFKLM